MAKKNQAPDIDKLDFEAAMAELESLVRGIEGGETPLAETIAQFERGVKLAAHCKTLLDVAERKVRALMPTGETADFE